MGWQLFTYGSLMFADVWRAVAGVPTPSETGRLRGYAIFRVKGETYPGIVPAEGDAAIVEGRVYRDVDRGSLERLDRFEGEAYRRETVRVATAGGDLCCQAYVIRPEFRHILSPEGWSADGFETNGLNAFLSSYKGFRAL